MAEEEPPQQVNERVFPILQPPPLTALPTPHTAPHASSLSHFFDNGPG